MKSIGTRFSLAVGTFAVVFSAIILYRAWSSTRDHTERLVALEADLALEFDLAIREYAGEAIRPAMEKRIQKDDFVVEAMSTSYIARRVFEKVRRSFPDYVLKFSSDNPRNPDNKAGPEEAGPLQYFRDNPQETRWVGKLEISQGEYLAHVNAMRIEPSCLRCHGRPEDSPKSLLDRYGTTGGFYREVGDVAGLDVIAIPMAKVQAALLSDATRNIVTTAIWLLMLSGAILITFRYLVARRLAAISTHFQKAATQPEDAPLRSVPVQGNDEISILSRSFNALADRLRGLYESLEDRVRQRTAELTRERQTLQHLLRSSDHERRLIAYEIHDGLSQQLAGAVMQFQAYEHQREQNPAQAAKAYEAGVQMLDQGLAEARRLISGVRPPILDESGVVAAIAHLIQQWQPVPDPPRIEFLRAVEFDRLAPVMENAVYRIVQEALANALRYSQSQRIQVHLVQDGMELRIVVQDWGIGFRLEDVKEGCFGLAGIRERARLLGGKAIIEATPGEGTRITVNLPIVSKEAIE